MTEEEMEIFEAEKCTLEVGVGLIVLESYRNWVGQPGVQTLVHNLLNDESIKDTKKDELLYYGFMNYVMETTNEEAQEIRVAAEDEYNAIEQALAKARRDKTRKQGDKILAKFTVKED